MKKRCEAYLPFFVLFCGILAYSNSFYGVFLFDDYTRLVNHAAIRHFWSSILYSSRPLVGFTFFINYRLCGMDPACFIAVNVALHLASSLLLFGLVRRTFLLPSLKERFGHHAAWLGAAVAALWVVHPLSTAAVTYIVQRAEGLMGFLFLSTLYCFVVGLDSPKSHRWHTAAILSCALGMAAKQIMVAAPVMVILYDRFFVAGSFVEAVKRRWRFYAGLGATYLVGAILLIAPNESTSTFGIGHGLPAPWEYFLIQQGIILHYLKLAFWPVDLCFDYVWLAPPVWKETMGPVIVMGAIYLAVLWGFVRRQGLGYVGLWVFLILAPTSSVFPVADFAFEHRMYLSLAGIIVMAVLLVFRFFSGRSTHAAWPKGKIIAAGVLFLVVLVALGSRTRLRNKDYHSVSAMYTKVVQQRPHNYRAWTYLVNALLQEGRFSEAEQMARRMVIRITEDLQEGRSPYIQGPASAFSHYPEAYGLLGRTFLAQQKLDEAIPAFQEAVRTDPDALGFQYNLSLASYLKGDVATAMEGWRSILQKDPGYGRAHEMLGLTLGEKGNWEEAIEHYRRAVNLLMDPFFSKTELAWFLAAVPDEGLRNGKAALALALSVCEVTQGRSPRALDVLAAAYAETGDFENARETQIQALRFLSAGGIEGISVPAMERGKGMRDAEKLKQLQSEMEERLRLYEQRRPYRIQKALESLP